MYRKGEPMPMDSAGVNQRRLNLRRGGGSCRVRGSAIPSICTWVSDVVGVESGQGKSIPWRDDDAPALKVLHPQHHSALKK